MRILVTGGRGFIGSHVIDELIEQYPQAEIICMTRDPSKPTRWGGRVRLIYGDVRNTNSLIVSTSSVDVVIHCVQFPNHPIENPRKGLTYEEIDGRGTARLVEACVRNGVKRFIYLSGAGVAPGREEPWFRAKLMAEEAIQKSGLEYVIFRPSWVYGPEDHSLNRFIKFIKYSPVVPLIGDGQNRVQPVSVFDLARVIAMAVAKGEATNNIYEIGGPEVLTMNEVLQITQRVLGKRRLFLHLPIGLVKAAAHLLGLLPNPPLTPGAVDFITMEALVDPQKAIETFGVESEPLEEGLRRYLSAG